MLLKRILTAAVLVPILLAAVLWGRGWPFLLLAGAVVVLCAREYGEMCLPSARDRRAGLALSLATYAAGALTPASAALPSVLACVALAVFHVLPGDLPPADKARRAGALVVGAVYVGGFLSAWPRTLFLPGGEHWVITGLLAVAAGDTAAYAVGRAMGKRPLAPHVSPNKTVEGAVGGLAASAVAGGLYAVAFIPGLPAGFAAAGCAVVGAVGQAGDLFESLLKRAANVKDSGSLLPGHGGMFDRADAAIAAGPVLYLMAVLAPLPVVR